MDNNVHTNHSKTTPAERIKDAILKRWDKFQCDMSNEEFRELTEGLSTVKVAEITGANKSQVQTYRRFKSPARVPKEFSDRLKEWLKNNDNVERTAPKFITDMYPKVSIETFNKITQGMKRKVIADLMEVDVRLFASWKLRKCDIPLEYVKKITSEPVDDSLIIYEPTHKPYVRKKTFVPDVEPLNNKQFRALVADYSIDEIAEYVRVTPAKVERWLRKNKPRKISPLHTDRIYDFIVYKRTGVDVRTIKELN